MMTMLPMMLTMMTKMSMMTRLIIIINADCSYPADFNDHTNGDFADQADCAD